MSISRQIGSMLIIMGTTIGAGILALPMVSAGASFPYSAILLCILWAMMLYGALLLLEVNLIFPHGSSFSTLSGRTLGRGAQIVTNLSMVFLFYCLSAAYISGGSGVITTGLEAYFHAKIPLWISALIFTVILGALVSWKTSAVDIANRLLLAVKMLAFLSVTFLLLPHINYSQLNTYPGSQRFVLIAIPIFFTAFGFHGSVPSIVKYVGQYPKALRRIFFIGSIIPLVLYLLWEIVTLGILPRTGNPSFASIAQQNGSVGEFITALSQIINNQYINFGINFFTDIAMTTSYLGVNLGLFDFFHDILRGKHEVTQRLWAAFITFVPPLFFALMYPKGFIIALGYASIPLAWLAILLPALMAWRTRKTVLQNYPYKVAGGNSGLVIIFILGVAVIVLQILAASNLLPSYT